MFRMESQWDGQTLAPESGGRAERSPGAPAGRQHDPFLAILIVAFLKDIIPKPIISLLLASVLAIDISGATEADFATIFKVGCGCDALPVNEGAVAAG